jgi:multicomponent Na+:H+ antiporter subunit F
MNAWMIAATVTTCCLIPCGVVCMRGDPEVRLVGLEGAATILVVVLVLLAEGLRRLIFLDLPLTLALLAFGGGLVFARFLERWM